MQALIEYVILLVCCFCLFLVGGCDLVTASDTNRDIIKTSHKQIVDRFSLNSDEASKYYKGKAVCLSGSIDAVYEFGTVVIATDSKDIFRVNFAEGSRHELMNLNTGDPITVSCKKVSNLYLGDCEVMK